MMTYVYAAVGAVILSLSGLLWLQTNRLATCKDEFSQFKGGVAALGEAAKLANQIEERRDKLNKEKADAENARTTADKLAAVKRVRDNNPSRSVLPAPAPTTSRPDLLCLNRAEYQRADGIAVEKLFAGARGLADEGTKNTVDLDTAKYWAKGR